MSSKQTPATQRRHAVWPAAVILLPLALLTGHLAGAWISRIASGPAMFDIMSQKFDAAMEPLDPLGLAKFVRVMMEEDTNGK